MTAAAAAAAAAVAGETDPLLDRIIEVLGEIVAIPSVNPMQAGRRSGPGGEAAMARWLADAAGRLGAEVTLGSPAFYERPESELVALLAALGGGPPAIAGYGSNALVYPPIAGETVVFGPGSIDQAHKAVEWVETAELARAATVYREVLTT